MDSIRDYYQRINATPIGEVAGELIPVRITKKKSFQLLCDCPNHQSKTKTSLAIDLIGNQFIYFGCQKGGGVLQFVEFIQSGTITHGCGSMPPSHQRARDYLAAKAGLPKLSEAGYSKEQLAAHQEEAVKNARAQKIMGIMVEHFHLRLLHSHEMMAWLEKNYGLTKETIKRRKLGYSNNEPAVGLPTPFDKGTIDCLKTEMPEITNEDLCSTGAFIETSQKRLIPLFNNRVIIPHFRGGLMDNLTGRKTGATPDNEYERAKYKKLLVYNDTTHKHIAKCVTSRRVFNIDCLMGQNKKLVIVEGFTDCLILDQKGIAAITPGTVRFCDEELEKLIPRLKGIPEVFVCMDNELNAVGEKSARDLLAKLQERGVLARRITLPLGEKQLAAREMLRVKYGITDAATLQSHKDWAQDHEIAALVPDAKTDVCTYFTSGKTGEDFAKLMAEAKTLAELMISGLVGDMTPENRDRGVRELLALLAPMDDFVQDRHLREVKKLCPWMSMKALRKELSVIRKKKEEKEADDKAASLGRCSEDSLRVQIEKQKTLAEMAGEKVDYVRIGEQVYDWFVGQGAKVFRTEDGRLQILFKDKVYRLDSGDPVHKRELEALVYEHAGVVAAEIGGRIVIDTLTNCAALRAIKIALLSWIHTDIANHIVYIHLGNAGNEIARIAPEGVTVIKNGSEPDGVILSPSPKMRPINFISDVDLGKADAFLREFVIDNLSCAPSGQRIIVEWMFCVLLIDFLGTKPVLRLEGPQASGKTFCLKVMSVLIYGTAQQKMSTDAANYTDGAQNPVIILDNIEGKQMTQALLTFLLIVATGITKEKRRRGTDTENIREQPKCLVVTSGIEPLGAEYAEVQTRTFVIPFDRAERTKDYLLEADLVARLEQNRNVILSALFIRVARVLKLRKDGAQERVMKLLHDELGDHSKARANDFLSMMYLIRLAMGSDEQIDSGLARLCPELVEQVRALGRAGADVSSESNQIANCLRTLFQAEEQTRITDAMTQNSGRMSAFMQRYPINIRDSRIIDGVSAAELFNALRTVSRDYNLPFDYKNVSQFAQRLASDKEAISASGFGVKRYPAGGGNRHVYDVEYQGVKGVKACGKISGLPGTEKTHKEEEERRERAPIQEELFSNKLTL